MPCLHKIPRETRFPVSFCLVPVLFVPVLTLCCVLMKRLTKWDEVNIQKMHARTQSKCMPRGKLVLLQVKALTSLEVARQRQANRAQLQLGLPAQYQGPFPRPAPTAGQLQPSRLPHAPYPGQWAGQMQQKGLLGPKPAGDALGRRLGSIQEKLPTRVEADPAQKARAKLHAIRNELGEVHSVFQCSMSFPVLRILLQP